MKVIFKKFGHGILIGISNLIPGFSGGTMALILGIYEEFTGAIASFTKTPFKSIKELWSLFLGMFIGIVIATFTVAICLQKWPLITSSFFVGLVIATIPLTIKNAKGTKNVLSSWISFVGCFIFSLLLPFADKVGIVIDLNNHSLFIIFFVFFIAALAAATMIIPAASGSLILLAFGLFEPIVVMLKDCLVYLTKGDFLGIWNHCYILIPFALGCLIGVIMIAKIITYLFNNKANIIWYGILGLLFSSIFTIYYDAFDTHILNNLSLLTDHLIINIILSIVMFAAGLLGLNVLMKVANQKRVDVDENHDQIAA